MEPIFNYVSQKFAEIFDTAAENPRRAHTITNIKYARKFMVLRPKIWRKCKELKIWNFGK